MGWEQGQTELATFSPHALLFCTFQALKSKRYTCRYNASYRDGLPMLCYANEPRSVLLLDDGRRGRHGGRPRGVAVVLDSLAHRLGPLLVAGHGPVGKVDNALEEKEGKGRGPGGQLVQVPETRSVYKSGPP